MMDMPLPEPEAYQWLQRPPGGNSKWDYDGYWVRKGSDRAPLFTADQLHARDAQWRAIVAAEVAKEREKSAAMRAALINLRRAYVRLLENGRDRIRMLGGECDPVDKMEQADPALRDAAAAIRAGSPGTAPPSEPV